MEQFYGDAASLFAEAYDAFYTGEAPQMAGDVAFYERLAREAGGPTLEIACGTGRVALALVQKGLDVTGVDLSEGMLTVARRKVAALPAGVRDRLTLVSQDMSELNLGRAFGFIFVPFRSFQHLLTIDLQRRSLEAIRRHLATDGRLALHLFDPRLDRLIDENTAPSGLSGTDPLTRRRISGATASSTETDRSLPRTPVRSPSAGHTVGSCITCSRSAVSRSSRNTATSQDLLPPMARR
jgi:SAM-dependent methyltransferase